MVDPGELRGIWSRDLAPPHVRTLSVYLDRDMGWEPGDIVLMGNPTGEDFWMKVESVFRHEGGMFSVQMVEATVKEVMKKQDKNPPQVLPEHLPEDDLDLTLDLPDG